MTPDKRRPAAPASQGPTRVAPDVPIAPSDAPVSDVPPSPSEAPVSDRLVTPAPLLKQTPPKETGLVRSEDRAKTQSQRRPLSLYPLPVWPD